MIVKSFICSHTAFVFKFNLISQALQYYLLGSNESFVPIFLSLLWGPTYGPTELCLGLRARK
jgi:hypothetical protein